MMDIVQPTTTTESQSLTSMLQYYGNMWTIWSHILAPLTEVASGTEDRKLIFTDVLEEYFKGLKHMVSSETVI